MEVSGKVREKRKEIVMEKYREEKEEMSSTTSSSKESTTTMASCSFSKGTVKEVRRNEDEQESYGHKDKRKCYLHADFLRKMAEGLKQGEFECLLDKINKRLHKMCGMGPTRGKGTGKILCKDKSYFDLV